MDLYKTLLACLLWITAHRALSATEVQGEHENPNQTFGRNANYQLVGDCKFGWRSGTISGDVSLNGHSLVMETGGGNHTVLSGAVSGSGSVTWRGGGVPQVAPSILAGDRPNTFRGTFTLSRGVLELNKPEGADAIPSDLVLGVEGSAVVRLQKRNQINDAASVTFTGKEICVLDLAGHSERFSGLTLKAHAEIHMGQLAATLEVGDCGSCSWDFSKTLTIFGFKPGKDRVVFGHNSRGLSESQVQRIGFASPVGMPEGLYSARITADGAVEPSALVRALQTPFDLSAKAREERERFCSVNGLADLRKAVGFLPQDAVIAFFGDSLTWQNGYIEWITRRIRGSDGSPEKNLKLLNRGINGGGILQVRDGVSDGAFPGKSAQKPFAEVISAERVRVAVVFVGINDVWWRHTSEDVFESALRDLVTQARANRTTLVLATLALRGELPDGSNSDDVRIEHFAEITRRVARESQVTLVDTRRAVVAYLQNHNVQLRVDGTLYFKPSGVLTYDGVHPNGRGVEFLAELIAEGVARGIRGQTK